jgi:hypothetical protein
MKSTEFKKLIKEAVKEAIQEELKDILLEAVRAPKTPIQEAYQMHPVTVNTPSAQPTLSAADKRTAYDNILSGMKANGGNINMTTADLGNFQVQPGTSTVGEGSALPSGNVGLDQIMSLIKSR